MFVGCKNISDYFSVVFVSAATDIRYLILIFAMGFTYLCGIASSAFVVCRGFTLGFSINFLYNAVKIGEIKLKNPMNSVYVFAATELAIAIFIIFLSTRSLIFSYDFRKLRGRRSLMVRSPALYKYLILYLTAFGLMILINLFGCIVSAFFF